MRLPALHCRSCSRRLPSPMRALRPSRSSSTTTRARTTTSSARCQPTSRRSTPASSPGWKRTGRTFEAYDAADRQCESRVPLLHSAGAGRFALLLGVADGMPADGSEVPDVRRGVDGGDVRRPARCDDRRLPGRRHPGLSRVGQPRRFESSLHDRPQPAHADGGARLDRRRLRPRPGDHVRAVERAGGVAAAAVHEPQSESRGAERAARHVRVESQSSRCRCTRPRSPTT